MTPPDVDLSVVVPAYDEAVVIAGSLQRLGAFLAEWPGGAEILVVDDGSDDGTFGIVEALIGRLGVPMRLHRHPENQGKGAAVRTGMLRARGRLVRGRRRRAVAGRSIARGRVVGSRHR